MMADAENPLEFLEGGVGMFFDVNLEFLRVEFAPMTPAGFGSQRPRLHGVQIAVNGAVLRPRSKHRAASALELPDWMNFTTRSRKSSA